MNFDLIRKLKIPSTNIPQSCAGNPPKYTYCYHGNQLNNFKTRDSDLKIDHLYNSQFRNGTDEL